MWCSGVGHRIHVGLVCVRARVRVCVGVWVCGCVGLCLCVYVCLCFRAQFWRFDVLL